MTVVSSCRQSSSVVCKSCAVVHTREQSCPVVDSRVMYMTVVSSCRLSSSVVCQSCAVVHTREQSCPVVDSRVMSMTLVSGCRQSSSVVCSHAHSCPLWLYRSEVIIRHVTTDAEDGDGSDDCDDEQRHLHPPHVVAFDPFSPLRVFLRGMSTVDCTGHAHNL